MIDWGFTLTCCGYIIIIFCLFYDSIDGEISGYSISTLGALFSASKLVSSNSQQSFHVLFNLLLPILFFIIIYIFSLTILIKFKDKIKYHPDNFKTFSIISIILLFSQLYIHHFYSKYIAGELFITCINISILIALGTILKYYTTDGFHIIRNM